MAELNAVILDGFTQNPGDMNWDYLAGVTNLTVYDRTPPELTVQRARDAQIVITNKVPLTREIIDNLPLLRFVALLSTGSNIADCDYLKQKGIPVSNIPAYSTQAVAQMVTAYILGFSNSVAQFSASVRQGDWEKCPDFCYLGYPLFELGSKTIGIIGYGSIGSAVAKRANAMGMRIVAYTPSGSKANDYGVEFMPLNDVLALADFVTVHTPLTAQTQGMVNADFIAHMKRGAYLINTSRGQVVNEHDVAAALESGVLAGFAADVLSCEPPKSDNPLLRAPNTVITPHVAWAAFETRVRLLEVFNGNIRAYLQGNPVNVVNA